MGGEHDAFIKVIIVERIVKAAVLIGLAIGLLVAGHNGLLTRWAQYAQEELNLEAGNGLIVQRGFTRPPNFHTDLSRGLKLRGMAIKLTEVPVGYLFEVISKGYGAMPDYAQQLPADDRWAVIAYLRALQLSQGATLADVRDPQAKQRLLQTRGGQQ